MKRSIKLLIILLVAFSFTMNAQDSASQAKATLNDPQMKSEIIQLILADEVLRAEVMGELIKAAENDPAVCEHMCSMMMHDEHMASAIAEKILELQGASGLDAQKKKHVSTFHKSKRY